MAGKTAIVQVCHASACKNHDEKTFMFVEKLQARAKMSAWLVIKIMKALGVDS